MRESARAAPALPGSPHFFYPLTPPYTYTGVCVFANQIATSFRGKRSKMGKRKQEEEEEEEEEEEGKKCFITL